MTVRQAIAYTAGALEPISDEAASEAEIIVSFVTGTERGRLAFFSGTVDEGQLQTVIEQRKKRIPLQYIMGKWGFYKGEFLVGEGVLIPRQDTETLVETAAAFLRDKPSASVADLCAGSGCVGISLAEDFPGARVTAVEKYAEAMAYLKKNIELSGVPNVTPLRADVTEGAFGSYDLIVSNPPYLSAQDMEALPPEVKKEPPSALFGGNDGLYFYRVLAEKWTASLKPGGMLAAEVGIGQSEAVAALFEAAGLESVGVKNDLCGVQRVVFGTASQV